MLRRFLSFTLLIGLFLLSLYGCWPLDSEYDPDSEKYVIQEPTLKLYINNNQAGIIGSSIYPGTTNLKIENIGKSNLIITSVSPVSALTTSLTLPYTIVTGTPLELVIDYSMMSTNANFVIESNAANGDCVITLVKFN